MRINQIHESAGNLIKVSKNSSRDEPTSVYVKSDTIVVEFNQVPNAVTIKTPDSICDRYGAIEYFNEQCESNGIELASIGKLSFKMLRELEEIHASIIEKFNNDQAKVFEAFSAYLKGSVLTLKSELEEASKQTIKDYVQQAKNS